LGVERTDTIKLELILRLEHSPSTMVSPVGKSTSSKEEETSKPEEKAEAPITSLIVPLKEVTTKTAKTAANALAWELLATRATKHEPVAFLDNGMSRSPLYLDHNECAYSPDASFFNVSPPSDQQVSECLRTDRRRILEKVFVMAIEGGCSLFFLA
jgi:hypothetical protein